MDRKDLKITVKIFISSPNIDSLKEALDQGISIITNCLLIDDTFIQISNKCINSLQHLKRYIQIL